MTVRVYIQITEIHSCIQEWGREKNVIIFIADEFWWVFCSHYCPTWVYYKEKKCSSRQDSFRMVYVFIIGLIFLKLLCTGNWTGGNGYISFFIIYFNLHTSLLLSYCRVATHRNATERKGSFCSWRWSHYFMIYVILYRVFLRPKKEWNRNHRQNECKVFEVNSGILFRKK